MEDIHEKEGDNKMVSYKCIWIGQTGTYDTWKSNIWGQGIDKRWGIWNRGKTGHISYKGKPTRVTDSSITSLLVLQCCYRNPTMQANSWQIIAVPMISEQVGKEGNCKKKGEGKK